MGYACTYMHVPVCLCARSHRFSTWIALLQQKVIYESEFNKHVRMIYAQTHTRTQVFTCVCVCVCRCESMWHTMRCRYVCMGVFVSGIYVCTNIRILLTEFAAAAVVAKQNTPQHTTHNRSQHSTTQHNTTKQNAQQRDPIRTPFDTSAWNESWLITGFPFELYLQKFAATARVQRRRQRQRQRQPMADCRPTTNNRPPTRPRTQRRRHRQVDWLSCCWFGSPGLLPARLGFAVWSALSVVGSVRLRCLSLLWHCCRREIQASCAIAELYTIYARDVQKHCVLHR